MAILGMKFSVYKGFILYGVAILGVALGLIIYQAVFTTRPGPTIYESHFSGLIFAISLAFETVQLALVATTRLRLPQVLPVGDETGEEANPRKTKFSRTEKVFAVAYWGVLAVSGLVCAIAYRFPPHKGDCIATNVLIFTTALVGSYLVIFRPETGSSLLRHARLPIGLGVDPTGVEFDEGAAEPGDAATGDSEPVLPKANRRYIDRRLPKPVKVIGRWFNRLLKLVHGFMSILFIAGGIQLALSYNFDNPGQTVSVILPGGSSLAINYLCVSPSNSANSTNDRDIPTIWFETSLSHGIVDMIGLQEILSSTHGLESCSYDPPSFGWSSPLPSSESDFDSAFLPLLDSIGRRHDDRIVIGWGGGAELAMKRALEEPDVTKGVVLLDVYPDGIEWLDAKRKNGWTDAQMLAFRETDLRGRVALARLILMLAIPWGILSLFVPRTETADPANDTRHRAQGMKEDMWAANYFWLRRQVNEPLSDYLETTVLPPDQIPVYAILANNTENDAESNAFYQTEKAKLVEHIAGGELANPIEWCKEEDCSLLMPVDRAEWTAGAIARFIL